MVSVTPTWCRELAEIAGRTVDLVHNGYDEEDVIPTNKSVDAEFSISHIGSINSDRNPEILWVALSLLLEENEEFRRSLRIKLVGNVEPVVFADLEKYQLTGFVEKVGYLSHQEAVEFQQTSQILLLLINNTPNANGILTGKLYEYIASRRPVLCIGPPESDIANLLKETKSGSIVGFEDVDAMKKVILELFEKYKNNRLQSTAENYEQYSRKAQCGIMAQLLDNFTN